MSVTITRGTTPTIEVQVDADLEGFNLVLSIGKPHSSLFDVYDPVVEPNEDGTLLSFRLTQEQTLGIKAGVWRMQVRGSKNGEAVATDMLELEVLDAICNYSV